MATTLVNRDTNRVWLQRLRLVEGLVEWVRPKLIFKRARDQNKAAQYVYGHLCLGKMLFPGEANDPLFTKKDYDDKQMREQIGDENYLKFRIQLAKAIWILQNWNPEEFEVATWGCATEGLPHSCIKVLKRLQNELCDEQRFDRAPLGQSPDDYVHQNMIGVVLRGRCIGAFDNNLHGSVLESWQGILRQIGTFYECFASPFNHKFDNYYSMFEEDRAFGSRGNFFSMVHKNKGILPDGHYEMNPVFMNVMFEEVADILEHSIQHNASLFCIVVTAKWTDAPFYGKLLRLLDKPGYREHSTVSVDKAKFVQDLSDSSFTTDSAFWVFSMKKLPKGLMEDLLGKSRRAGRGEELLEHSRRAGQGGELVGHSRRVGRY